MNTWKVLNILSLAGVIILLLLVLNRKGETRHSGPAAPQAAVAGNIVFINSDTLRAHYDLITDMNDELEAQFKVRETEMTARQRTYEKDAAYFQQQVEKRTISEESAKVIYADLMKSQEQLLALRDRYTEELSEQEFIMNERFVDSVYTYLKRYQEDKGYDYILGFSRGSGILYAKDTLDITWDVIRGMNESYQAGKKKK